MNAARARQPRSKRHGLTIAAVCIVIVMINAALVHTAIAGTDDRSTIAWRAQTMRAFFAAESGIALIRIELAGGRTPENATLSLEPGVIVTLERSADDFPMTVIATGRAGIARQRVEATLEWGPRRGLVPPKGPKTSAPTPDAHRSVAPGRGAPPSRSLAPARWRAQRAEADGHHRTLARPDRGDRAIDDGTLILVRAPRP